MRRALRFAAGGFLLSFLTVDLALVAGVAIVGASNGYRDTAAAVWTYRTEHLELMLACSVTMLGALTATRRLLGPRLLCRVGLHAWETRQGFSSGWYETWHRCERVGCTYDHWHRVDARLPDSEGHIR